MANNLSHTGPSSSSSQTEITATPSPDVVPAYQAWLLLIAAILAMVSLHAYPLLHPLLFDDDFGLLPGSWDWPTTWNNLLVPFNDNVMPMGRLTIWMVVRLAGRITVLPWLTSSQGPLALAVAMVLVYVFVRREMSHRFYGLVAAILFGITVKYEQAINWFAASFLTVTLDVMLLALLSAQRWRQTGRPSAMAWCIFWVALSPGWFPTGIIAGPLCTLYLLPRDEQPGSGSARGRARALLPLIGTVAFLAMAVPQNFRSLFLEKRFVADQTLMQVFDPRVGLLYTARSVVDNLVFGVIGVLGKVCPIWLLPVPWIVIVLVGAWWWRCATHRRLLLLGCGLIFLSYWLTYSARTHYPYEGTEHPLHQWTRYNLLPFLGLVLFFCGGLPSRQGTLFQLDLSGLLTRGQFRALALLIVTLVGLQLPLSWVGHMRTAYDQAKQMAVLRHIEEVDARCRAHHISAEDARRALGFLEVPYTTTPGTDRPPRISGWDWLNGSDDPLPHEDLEEVRRLLEPTP
jgi:hypothetical protein